VPEMFRCSWPKVACIWCPPASNSFWTSSRRMSAGVCPITICSTILEPIAVSKRSDIGGADQGPTSDESGLRARLRDGGIVPRVLHLTLRGKLAFPIADTRAHVQHEFGNDIPQQLPRRVQRGPHPSLVLGQRRISRTASGRRSLPVRGRRGPVLGKRAGLAPSLLLRSVC
jgi:hypothetical protein